MRQIRRFIIVMILIIFLTCFRMLLFASNDINRSTNLETNLGQDALDNMFFQESDALKSSSVSRGNAEIIEEIFDAKLDNYSNLGYFPQVYEPSLQATYYALHALNTIDKLNEINQTKIVNYVMSHYNTSSHVFMDKYAYRYLDTDISKVYYPLSSVLEVNCYSILSLDLLNRLDLIEIQDSIAFIWSCYNPTTSGFIGQPYDLSLPDFFKTSTMDNTYFAILTLNLLINDWTSHSIERDALVQYINGLQSTSGFHGKFGGFSNDEDSMFNTLEMYEPNLLSSYYCVKSLEIFDMIDTIRISDFHQYLTELYDSENNFFIVNFESSYDNFINIVATAIGLELSDLTGFTGIDRNAVVNFILDNRNSLGTWDQSTDVHYHELIDTFQVLRSFTDAGELSQLNAGDREQIADTLATYYHYYGYSHLSKDYTSQELLYLIANAFNSYDRTSELDIDGIYSKILNSYYHNSYLDCQGFVAHVNVEENKLGFRSRPIEYYASGHHDYITEIDTILSHKSTFIALESLKTISKLEHFDAGHDLGGFMGDIIDSQFLEQGYDNYGAFLPFLTFTLGSPEYQDKKIFFEYSYYAIKTFELLTDYFELGNVTDLDFDKDALTNYIANRIVETPSEIFFDPQYTDYLSVITQNTYYAIHVLKTLNAYDLDNEKIKNFVVNNLDYDDMKNFYYSYKISEILDLNISFESEQSQALTHDVYSGSAREFFLTTEKKELGQEIFSWVCYMAKNDEIRVNLNYSSLVLLGSHNIINASFCNVILESFGSYTTVKFESEQLPVYILEKVEQELYQANIFVSIEPTCYPNIMGNLCVYENLEKITETPISFQTTYDISMNSSISEVQNIITIKINTSLLSGIGQSILLDSAYIETKIYKNELYLGKENFSRLDRNNFTEFILNYTPEGNANYLFEIFLFDGFELELKWVANMTREGIVEIECNCLPSVKLGSLNIINASLINTVSSELVVVFESEQLGNIDLEKIGINFYEAGVFVPVDLNNYPIIEGMVRAYEGSEKVAETPISFNTTYELSINVSSFNNSAHANFGINISMLTDIGYLPLNNSQIYTEIYLDGNLLEVELFSRQNFSDYSKYDLKYQFGDNGTYAFEIFLYDGFKPDSQKIYEVSFYHSFYSVINTQINEEIDNDGSDEEKDDSEENSNQTIDLFRQASIPLALTFILVPGCIISYTSFLKKKKIGPTQVIKKHYFSPTK